MGISVNEIVNSDGAGTAGGVDVIPGGTLNSTSVQNAIIELDSEKVTKGNLQLVLTGGTIVLTEVQFAITSIDVTGVLTSNAIIEIPDGIAQNFIVDNSTTGAFTLTVKHNLTAGVNVPRTERHLLYTTGSIVEGVTAVGGGGGAVTSVHGRLGAVVSQSGDYTKAQVGLANVDNTSDINKPVSLFQQNSLDLKQDLALKDSINGYAGLDGSGKINPNQLPSLALTDTFPVASEVAMLALPTQTGDVAVRSDINKSYILRGTDPSLLGDWQELLTPTDAVTSVFARSGVVTAQNGDYIASQITNIPAGSLLSTTVQGAVNELDIGKSSISHIHLGSAITNTPSGNLIATDVQTAINELDTEKSSITHVHTASAITNVAFGNLIATDVQGAINELDAEKATVSHTHLSADVTDLTSTIDANTNVIANTAVRHSHANQVVLDLTTASYTTAEETKLASIATGANLYVHPNHTGDVASTGDGNTVIQSGAVTLPKMENRNTATFIGRNSVGIGSPEELSATVARGILNVEDGATADQTGAEIKSLYEAELNTNVYSDAEKAKLAGIDTSANLYIHPDHSGDVTSVADGVQTIAIGAVTLAKMANISTASFLGRNTAGTGTPEVLAPSTVRSILNIENGATADQISSEVPFTPVGNISAINVQSAIAELDIEKSDIAHVHPYLNLQGAVGGQTIAGGIGNGDLTVTGHFKISGVFDYDDVLSNLNFGTNSLSSVSTGAINIALGGGTLQSLTSGTLNVCIGQNAGQNVNGHENFFLGSSCGLGAIGSTAQANVAIGKDNMSAVTTASHNVAIGKGALNNTTTSMNNVCLGSSSGSNIVSGNDNIAIGSLALAFPATGVQENICLGNFTGLVVQGNKNVCLGSGSGSSVVSNNVLLGYHAGSYEGGSSNTFLVDSIDRGSQVLGQEGALLYGLFNSIATSQILSTPGKFGVGTIFPTQDLEVSSSTNPIISIEDKNVVLTTNPERHLGIRNNAGKFQVVFNTDGTNPYTNVSNPLTVLPTGKTLINTTVDSDTGTGSGVGTHMLQTNGFIKHKAGWRDNIISFTAGKSGAVAPTWANMGNNIFNYRFSVGDTMHLNFHVDHDYLPGSVAYPHIHFTPTTTMTAGQTVVWTMVYVVARGHSQGDSLTGATTTITLTYTATGTEVAGEHIVVESSLAQAFSLLEPDSCVSFSVQRATGTYGSNVFGLFCDLHYQSDREVTLNKAPSFYV